MLPYPHLTVSEIIPDPWKVEYEVGRAERMRWGDFSVSRLAHNFMSSAVAKDDPSQIAILEFHLIMIYSAHLKTSTDFCLCFSYTHFFKRKYVATIIN